jgi:hypothetical protein
VLDHISGEETVYKNVDTVASTESSDHLVYAIEFLSSLIPIGMRPHELKLKAGTVILLHPNLMSSRGLYIGTRLTITRLQIHSGCVLYEVVYIQYDVELCGLRLWWMVDGYYPRKPHNSTLY